MEQEKKQQIKKDDKGKTITKSVKKKRRKRKKEAVVTKTLKSSSEATVSETKKEATGNAQKKPVTKDAAEKKKGKKKKRKVNNSKKNKQENKIWNSINTGAAAAVTCHDKIQAACDRFFYALWVSIVEEYHDVSKRYKGTGRKMMEVFFMLIISVCVLFVIFEHFTVYEYGYNGRTLGYVKSQETVLSILNVTGEKLSENNDANIKLEKDNITFKRVSNMGKDDDDADQALSKLTYITDLEITAKGIYADGNLVAVVESDAIAESALEELKAYYGTPDEGMEVDKVNFKEEIEIKDINVKLTSVQNKSDAVDAMEKGTAIKISHIVKEDETLADIVDIYGVEKSQITMADTGAEATKVEIGDELVMTQDAGQITVEIVETGTMSEVVKYETIKKDSDEYYIGDTYTQQEGQDGKTVLTGTITKENGAITKEDIDKKEVIKEKVDEIILVGTKEKPVTASTGNFMIPMRAYTITSYFGYRWGTLHEGWDLANDTGTPIYASDGGTITTASYYGGYGLAIVIKHDNQYTTVYGHCSKLLVSVGDKVYQGQEIALVGSTGHSTGPHCHFEIRDNGTAVDPASVL